MGKNVLVSGYVGFSNFGDDVIFAMLTRHLKSKGFNVSALSANPQKTKKQYKINAQNYKNIFDIISEISKCDYLISGGGSLLQNATSNLSLLYYISIILLAKIMFKKAFEIAKRRNYRKASLLANNEHLVKFYQTIGFHVVDPKIRRIIINIP